MKTKILPLIAIAASLSAPLFAHAQSSNAPVTRASVRADLMQLEQAGYRPSAVSANYPVDLQNAERRVQQQQSSGSSTSGSSASGASHSVSDSGWNPNPVDNHPGA